MTKQELLDSTDVFLLDMDGTVYLGEKPIGNMRKTLEKLRKAGKKLVYCTNNSSRSPVGYEEKLKRIGLWGEGDFVYTSAIAAAAYLKNGYAGKSVYLLAADEVKADFKAQGILLTEENPDICVLAYDMTLDFAKMKKFNEFLAQGCLYVATHPDAVCPAEPVSMPDVGSFIELFKCSSGRAPDVICGKPYEVMGEVLSGLLNADKSRIAMVGDRLHTDIRFANNNGFKGVLVMSGETTEEILKASPDRPSIVLDSLNDLAPLV